MLASAGIPKEETVNGRHNDPTIVRCNRCGWEGMVKDCIHGYRQTLDDVEPWDTCPACNGNELEPMNEYAKILERR